MAWQKDDHGFEAAGCRDVGHGRDHLGREGRGRRGPDAPGAAAASRLPCRLPRRAPWTCGGRQPRRHPGRARAAPLRCGGALRLRLPGPLRHADACGARPLARAAARRQRRGDPDAHCRRPAAAPGQPALSADPRDGGDRHLPRPRQLAMGQARRRRAAEGQSQSSTSEPLPPDSTSGIASTNGKRMAAVRPAATRPSRPPRLRPFSARSWGSNPSRARRRRTMPPRPPSPSRRASART